MDNPERLDRRRFLLGALPAATLGALSLPGCSNEARGPTPQGYSPTYFHAAEWAFINAAVARLIPSEGQGPGGVEAGVPEFIDRQLELPYGHGAYFYMRGPFQPDSPPELGYQLRHTPRELYRLGIAAVDGACKQQTGKTFAELDAPSRDTFLTLLETGKSGILGP